MADQTSSIDELNEYLRRFAINSRDLGDSFDYAEKAADRLKREFTAGSRDVSKLRSSLQSSAEAIKEAERKYSDAQRKYNAATDAATKEQYRNQLAEARERKEQLAALHNVLDREVTARIDSIESTKVAFDALKTSAKTLKSTIGSVLGGLQGGAGAVGVAGGALMGGIAAAGSAGASAGAALSGLGAATAGLGGKFKWAGIAIDGFGKLLGTASKGLSEAAQAAIPYFIKEVERTLSSFQTMSASGAMFVDGMSGMRRAAGESGLSLETFSKIVSSNSAAFAATGMSVAGATARFAKINTIIGSGPGSLQQQMLNLGYSLEDIGSLTADVMSDLNRGGSLRYASDSQIAQLTADYSKDLRLLSSITGEDAKRKTEEARKLTTQLAVRSKLMELEQRQPGITKEFNTIMGQLPAEIQQSVMERMTTGAVFNAPGAQMMAQSKAVNDLIIGLSDTMTSGSASTEKFVQILGQAGDAYKQEQASGKLTAIGIAGLAGGAQQLNQGLSSTVGLLDKFSKDGVNKAIISTNGQARTSDELTGKVTEVVSTIEKMRVAMEKIVMDSGALKKFASVLDTVTDAMRDAIVKLGGTVAAGGVGSTVGSGVGGLAGAAAGGALGSVGGSFAGRAAGGVLGSLLGPAGTILGTLAGGALGDYLGGKIGEAISGLLGSGKALGGVSAGPTSGYLEKLHGVEAVVPLPDGRSIPVEMGGLGDLVSLMRENVRLAQDMVDTLKSSQDIQDRMLANSY